MERDIIQFKGIVRNTPGSSSEDGQFDEVQNLRFRDGAWRPVLDPLPLKGYEYKVDEDGEYILDDNGQKTKAENAGSYITHYIHATGDYKHLLGIHQDDRKLYWIADLATPAGDTDEVICQWRPQPQEIASCSKNARMVTNGNMCTFVSQEDFFHIFFRASDSEQRYVVLGGMLTDGLSATEIKPDYAPALRVKGWVVDKDRYPEQWNDERSDAANWKDKRGCKVARVYRFGWGSDAGEGDYGTVPELVAQVRTRTSARWEAIRNQETQEGFLHGFFWACTALKMYDGTYILHSRPVLMQQAADEQIRFGKFSFITKGNNRQEISDQIYIDRKNGKINEFCFLRRPQRSAVGNWDYKIVGQSAAESMNVQMEYSAGYNEVVQNSQVFKYDDDVRKLFIEQFDGTILYTGLSSHVPGKESLYGDEQNFIVYPYANIYNYFRDGKLPYLVKLKYTYNKYNRPSAQEIYGTAEYDYNILKTKGDFFSIIDHKTPSLPYQKGRRQFTALRYGFITDRSTLNTGSGIKTADFCTPNFLESFGVGTVARGGRYWSRGHEIATTHNILQIRTDKGVDSSYKDVIQSIAVFITPQIYGIDLGSPILIESENVKPYYRDIDIIDWDTDNRRLNNNTYIGSNMDVNNAFFSEATGTSGSYSTYVHETFMRIHHAPTRISDSELHEQLLQQRNFYKVKEFTWDEYQKDVVNHGWVTIDLKDVLSTLTEQEVLNIDSYTRSEYYSSVCQYYNGKLHIANYKENQFTGWPATYFKAEGYNYIAQNEDDEEREIKKSKGSIGNSADNDTNAETFNKMRQGVTASNLQAQRDFFKHHDGTQTLEIGTAGVAEAAWREDGVVIDESSLNSFFGRVKGYQMQIRVRVEDEDGNSRQYWRTTPLRYFSDLRLNAMLSFPDIRAKDMWIYTYVQFEARVGDRYADKWAILGVKSFDLDTDNGFNLAVYLSEDLRHIWAVNWKTLAKLVQGDYTGIALLDNPPARTQETISEYPNQLKVSEVNNPLYYPPENTYVVSNGSIMAMENDSISMQAGQYGTSPLYVFSSDGIYGLMVDASGELTYTNSRCVARDVVSDPHAIESTEAGVLFPTRHGLMSISNQVVTELSEPVEGPVVPWFEPGNIEELLQAQVAAGLRRILSNADEDGNPQPVFKFGDGALSHAEDEFKTFVQGAVIGYNYIDKEIWVSKAGQGTYVLGRNGWTRLSIEADKYVADFPHYYLQRDNMLYWLGREKTEDDGTGKKPAASCYFITRPVKLGSEDYKQALRLVLRCRLECEEGQMSSLLVWGSYDSRKWTCLGGIDRVGSVKDIGKVVNRTDCKYFRFAFFGRLQAGSVIDYAELGSERRLYANKIR